VSGEGESVLRSAGWLDREIAMHRAPRSGRRLGHIGQPSDASAVSASRPTRWPTVELTELLERRRSCRSFAPCALSVDDVFDIVVPAVRTMSGRPAYAVPAATPSIGVTVLVNRVTRPGGGDIVPGAYALSCDTRTMRCLGEASFERVGACVDLADVREPALVLVLCLHLHRRRQYVNAYELGLLEAGQLLQNIALVAAGVGVGCCVLGSVFDEPLWSVEAGTDDMGAALRRQGAPVVAVALGRRSGESTRRSV
jgi:hypothetical protein